MKKIFKHQNILIEKNFFISSIIIVVCLGLIIIRLWYLQIYKGYYYISLSEQNRIKKLEIPAPRGQIYDRYGTLILGNKLYYDLTIIPQYTKDISQTLKKISSLLNIPQYTLEKKIKAYQNQPKYLPITLKKNLTLQEVSLIEANKTFIPGISIKMLPKRDYSTPYLPSHLIGYLSEVDLKTLEKLKKNNTNNINYKLSDLIGKYGLEAKWEKYLKGKDGYKLIQVDALGRQMNIKEFTNYSLPSQEAEPGANLHLTLDIELQAKAYFAFKGKNGVVIAMNPQNGEILVILSQPSFNPAIYQDGINYMEWLSLINNPFKPLFDKTTGGEYIPGSIYKPLIALAALQTNVINPNSTKYECKGALKIGTKTFFCHKRTGHGIVDLKKALMESCDIFFYQISLLLGPDVIAKYAKLFNLGSPLNLNINLERSGLIPTSAWKKNTYGIPWQIGDTPNIGIGQGYTLLTPIQMAVLYAAIATEGKIFQPYVVQKVTDYKGKLLYIHKPKLIKNITEISQNNFKIIKNALQEVVKNPAGTGHKAFIPNIPIAGKTGSAQVVSLHKLKNNTDENASIKWKEHAIFAAFSPVDNPEIVVIIISENDKYGGGGAQAAPIAKDIIQEYWILKKQREKNIIAKQKTNNTYE